MSICRRAASPFRQIATTLPHRGLIAQDVAQACRRPNIDFGGYKDNSVRDPHGPAEHLLDYGLFIAPLVRAVHELSMRPEHLEKA